MNKLTLMDVKVLLAFLVRDRRADLVRALGEATAAAMDETLARGERGAGRLARWSSST